MQILADELDISEACFYYEDPEALSIWADAASDLNRSIGEVDKISSSHFTFSADCAKDETVIMSIPYEESWEVLCDGKRAETSPALGMLMSISVPEGSHVIEMKYTPEGTYAGLCLSLAGLAVLIIIMTKDGTLSGLKLLKRSKIQNLQK